MARKPLSPKTRFEVFKRDGFVCMYCGAHPPNAILEVDHIIALAAGGSDTQDNLVTSCFACNRGKSARDLRVAPMALSAKAAMVAEREEQLRGYNEITEEARFRLDDQAWDIIAVFDRKAVTYNRDRIQSIKRFIERLGLSEVIDAAEIAMASGMHSDARMFKYFCGVCWTKIKRQEGAGGS